MDDGQSTWWWSNGNTTDASRRVGEAFSSQEDAEGWLSASWQDLLDAGVEEVLLVHGDEPVYGPMPLTP